MVLSRAVRNIWPRASSQYATSGSGRPSSRFDLPTMALAGRPVAVSTAGFDVHVPKISIEAADDVRCVLDKRPPRFQLGSRIVVEAGMSMVRAARKASNSRNDASASVNEIPSP